MLRLQTFCNPLHDSLYDYVIFCLSSLNPHFILSKHIMENVSNWYGYNHQNNKLKHTHIKSFRRNP